MRYRKKPVVVEARRWYGRDNTSDVLAWVAHNGGKARLSSRDGAHHLEVDTLEGTTLASEGDWIIRGVHGEFYPCKPDIFEATYEEAR